MRQAAGSLAHPVSLLALVVMVINDHLLKQTYGSWLTGKLSDAAGLIFFPALVAIVVALVAPRAGWRTVRVAALVTTGVGFAVVGGVGGG